MAEMMAPPRPVDGLAPPPVSTARPTSRTEQGAMGQTFLTKGQTILKALVEMATERPDLSTQLSAIAAQVNDLVSEEAQVEQPEDLGTEEAQGPPPPTPRAPGPIMSPTTTMPMPPARRG